MPAPREESTSSLLQWVYSATGRVHGRRPAFARAPSLLRLVARVRRAAGPAAPPGRAGAARRDGGVARPGDRPVPRVHAGGRARRPPRPRGLRGDRRQAHLAEVAGAPTLTAAAAVRPRRGRARRP